MALECTAGTLQCSDINTKDCKLAMEGCNLLNQPLWQSHCSRPSTSTSVMRVLCLRKADKPLRMSGICSVLLLSPAARSGPTGTMRPSSSPIIFTAGVDSHAVPLHGHGADSQSCLDNLLTIVDLYQIS